MTITWIDKPVVKEATFASLDIGDFFVWQEELNERIIYLKDDEDNFLRFLSTKVGYEIEKCSLDDYDKHFSSAIIKLKVAFSVTV